MVKIAESGRNDSQRGTLNAWRAETDRQLFPNMWVQIPLLATHRRELFIKVILPPELTEINCPHPSVWTKSGKPDLLQGSEIKAKS